MTTDPIALLRDAENYLSALHGSVARHDHLAANLACAGCELRDRIAAALPELAAVSSAVVAPPTDHTTHRDRGERYAIAIHDAMETDLSLGDQEPAYQALIARAAEAAEALADAEQNRQFLTTLANLGITTHRLDRIRDAARLHRQQLLGTSELYAVIEADDEQPGARHVHITIHHPDPTTATTAAHAIADLIRGEYSDSLRLTITTDAPGTGAAPSRPADETATEWHAADPAVSAAVEPPADQTAARIAEAALTAVETALRDTLTADARKEALAGIAAVLPAADRAALRAAADRMSKKASALTEDLHDLAHFVAKDRLREAEILDREATELRRMADETATTETQTECTASRSGTCLREAESETACDTEAGECVHGGQPAAGARQDGGRP